MPLISVAAFAQPKHADEDIQQLYTALVGRENDDSWDPQLSMWVVTGGQSFVGPAGILLSVCVWPDNKAGDAQDFQRYVIQRGIGECKVGGHVTDYKSVLLLSARCRQNPSPACVGKLLFWQDNDLACEYYVAAMQDIADEFPDDGWPEGMIANVGFEIQGTVMALQIWESDAAFAAYTNRTCGLMLQQVGAEPQVVDTTILGYDAAQGLIYPS